MTRGARSTQGQDGKMHALFVELYLSGDPDDPDEAEAEWRSARARGRARARLRLAEKRANRRLA